MAVRSCLMTNLPRSWLSSRLGTNGTFALARPLSSSSAPEEGASRINDKTLPRQGPPEVWPDTRAVKLLNVPRFSLRRDVERIVKQMGDFEYETPFPVISNQTFQNRGEWVILFRNSTAASAFAQAMEQSRESNLDISAIFVRPLFEKSAALLHKDFLRPDKFYLLVKNVPHTSKEAVAQLTSRFRQNAKYNLVADNGKLWLVEFDVEADCLHMALMVDGNRFGDGPPVRSEVVFV